MPEAHRFAELVHELQQLERTPAAAQGSLILDAFARHTRFAHGALYLREARGSELRLAAKSHQCVAPEILAVDARPEDAVSPVPSVVVALQTHRESMGVLALSAPDVDELDDDVAF